MTSISYSAHARIRLRSRRVSRRMVADAIASPDVAYVDDESKALVAVKRTGRYYLVVVHSIQEEGTRVVTVYYASKVDRLISRKLARGAWRTRT